MNSTSSLPVNLWWKKDWLKGWNFEDMVGFKWVWRFCCRRYDLYVVAYRSVFADFRNTGRSLWLLKDSISKATASKGFLVLPDLSSVSCLRMYWSYYALNIAGKNFCSNDIWYFYLQGKRNVSLTRETLMGSVCEDDIWCKFRATVVSLSWFRVPVK